MSCYYYIKNVNIVDGLIMALSLLNVNFCCSVCEMFVVHFHMD